MVDKSELKSFQVEGQTYKTKFTKKYINRKSWAKPNPKMVSTVIPGTIVEIRVKEGDRVKRGDILFILEAMKMLNRIVAPIDGKIKSIFTIVGRSLAKGVVILEFE